jgi:hypothetical protein
MELGEVVIIPARHSFPSENEHGKIEGVESDEEKGPCDVRDLSMNHPAKHLWKPIVKRSEKAKTHAAEDDIMKVTNDPVSIVEMDIGSQAPGRVREAPRKMKIKVRANKSGGSG